MTPIKISVKNFRKLAESELDLSALSLVGISAPNGSGKSSLLTHAPLFALFGKPAPGCSLDDMVRTGTQDMSVTFDFEHNGEIYQVLRTRKLGKKSTCEFQQLVDGKYISLSGTTVKETEAKIEELLSLDANTFLSSSMILQGDANRFTKSLPSERKQILASILGLDIYSTLQDKSKAKAKSLELKLEGSKQELERLSNGLESLPQVETDLILAENYITHTTLDIRQKETELADLQAQIKDLEAKQLQAQQIQQQINTLSDEITTRKAEVIALNNRIVDAETVLKSEPELLQKQQQLTEIRQQIPALEAKVSRLKELQCEGQKLETDKKTLIGDRNAIITKVAVLNDELLAKDELQRASEQYQQSLVELKALDELASQHQNLMNQIREIEKLTDPLADKLAELRMEQNSRCITLDEYRRKSAILLNSGCPDPEIATCKFLQDAQYAKVLLPELETEFEARHQEYNHVEGQRIPLMEQIIALDQQMNELNYDPKYHLKLKDKVESLRLQAEQYTSLSGKEELLQNLIEQRQGLTDRINANLEQQDTLMKQAEAIAKDTIHLPDLKEQVAQLEPCEKQLVELPQAKAVIESALEQMKKLESEITVKNDQKGKLQQQHYFLDSDSQVKFDVAKNKEANMQFDLKELQSSLNALFATQGALQSRLDLLTADQQKHAELSQQIAPLAKELVRWELLVKAFSKNGIPVLILENALPELERIANDILSQMSAGAHSLQFITQRDAKSKDSQIETLDILVSDWAGTRAFESYSGGEQTRISLAIRFGLSNLLCNRAGSKIEWLVLDESLSSLDAEHMQLTVDAIKSVSNRFKKILVITHLDALKESFDQQIIMKPEGQVEIKYN